MLLLRLVRCFRVLYHQLRKLGVLLDMKDDLDALLDLAVDAEIASGKDSFADVDLSSPENDDEQQQPAAAPLLTSEKENIPAAARARAGVVEAASAGKIMSTLQNTSWEKDAGNEEATEVRSPPSCVCVLFLTVFFSLPGDAQFPA